MKTTTEQQTAIPIQPEAVPATEWKYLEARPGSRYKQLFFKNSRQRPFIVWRWMLKNNETLEEAAQNWNLPVEAVEEAIHYCESHEELLNAELAEERRLLLEAGVQLEPPPAR